MTFFWKEFRFQLGRKLEFVQILEGLVIYQEKYEIDLGILFVFTIVIVLGYLI